MSRLSQEQVLALAPDAAAVTAARGVANAAKWASAAGDNLAIWGEAKGSGAKPYQTAVDLIQLAYKCSCPSRKLPCKHSLGLLLRHANGEVPEGAAPDWVTEWLEKRTERSVKQAEKASAPQAAPDPEAAARRSEKRWGNILAGIEECEAFLEDAVAQGLLTVQSARSWDQMAARMVDAQANGLASRLQSIGSGIGVGHAWGETVVGQLGRLSLLCEAARRADSLTESLQCDIRSSVGIATRKEDPPAESILDEWDVLGQTIEFEERVSTCRSWLKARQSGRWAMHLSFSVASQPYDYRPVPGTGLSAMAHYYASAWPLRVQLDVRDALAFQPSLGTQLLEGLELGASVWAANPWADVIPVHLAQATLGQQGNAWFVLDDAGHAVPLHGGVPWQLLAMTGNEPCQVLGEWDGKALRLLGAWGDWGYLAL